MYIVKAVSYQGPRELNEDAIGFNDLEKVKCVVCDGVGSYPNADKAAQYVSEYICNKNNLDLLELIRECHDFLMNNHDKFGFTTIAAIEQVGESFVCYNVGDTRIYVIGNKTFMQISEDHTTQKKLENIYKGFYDVDEAKKMARYFSVLEAALGYKLDIYTTEYTLEDSDLIVIASDGAWDTSLEKSMKQVSQFLSPRKRAEFLIEHLKLLNDIKDGLEDNASLVLVWRE